MTKTMLISPPEQSILSEAGDRPSIGLLYLASNRIVKDIRQKWKEHKHTKLHWK